MNAFLIFAVLVFFSGIIFILPSCQVTTVYDLSLDTDSKIYAGEGEACETPYSKVECAKGLECILISTEPHRNGVCLDPEIILEEDFTNRYSESVAYRNE